MEAGGDFSEIGPVHDRLKPCRCSFVDIGGIPDADHVHAGDGLSSAKLER